MNTSGLGASWRLSSGIGSLFFLYFWFGITASQSSMDQMAIHLGPEFVFGFVVLVVYALVPGVCLGFLALCPQFYVEEAAQHAAEASERHVATLPAPTA